MKGSASYSKHELAVRAVRQLVYKGDEALQGSWGLSVESGTADNAIDGTWMLYSSASAP